MHGGRAVEMDRPASGLPEVPQWLRVLVPSTLIPALAFYFGWVSTNAIASYFGVDPSVLGLSAQDYALRSTDVLFIPAGAVLTAALLAVGTHSLILRHLSVRSNHVLLIPLILVVVGTGLFVLGVVAAWWGLPFTTPFLFPQLSPGLGMGLLAYGLSLRRHRLHLDDDYPIGPRYANRNGYLLSTVLVVTLVILSLFWATSEYASALGRGRAETLAGQIRHLPGAILYAKGRLYIDAPGVVEYDLGDPNSVYRYRYRGLRLLFGTADNYLLVPVLWKRATGDVIVLPKTGLIHLEFTTAGVP
jgi:hypothetical protein